MKSRLSQIFTLLIAGTLSTCLMAEPYADKVGITPETQPMTKMMIEAAKVPDRAVVGIPPYPGAKVIQTQDAGEMEMDGETMKTLAYIKLLSTDPMDKVVAWYTEQLEGYSKKDVYGVAWAFWKGQGEFNTLDMQQTRGTPNVMITDTSAFDYDKDMKGTKSSIEISYQ